MGFKIKKTVNDETVWEPIKAKKYTASKTIEYTGALPITINANGQPLLDYKIYGNTERTGTPTPENPIMLTGCGERTENMFDPDNTSGIEDGYYIDRTTGNKVSALSYYISAPMSVIGNETYTWLFNLPSSGAVHSAPTVGFYDSNDNQIGVAAHDSSVRNFTFTVPSDCTYIKASVYKTDKYRSMLTPGSTAPTSYIPYGYKLSMVSRGENLWNSELEQGTFDISTGEERDASERIRSDYIHIQNSDNYTITLTGAEGVVVYVYDANKSFLSAESTVEWQALPFTREIEANRYVRFAFAKNASGGYYEKITPSDVSNIMLVKGDTVPDSYIPYYREETSIYLGEVPTTRRIKKLVLTGEEEINLENTDSNRTVCKLSLTDCFGNFGFCTHIEWKSSYQSTEYDRVVWNNSGGGRLFISFSNVYLSSQTVQAFKAYLAAQYAAGTPVTVWYVLAEPETGIVNEPLMKIDNYADTVSMEQAGVSIPTNNGTAVIDYDGTTKPSQMYIKYNSWSGWSDIDNYKMVNGDWTQETT